MCNVWRTLSMAYFLKKTNEMTDFINWFKSQGQISDSSY